MTAPEERRERLIARLNRIREGLEQLIADKSSFNENRSDAAPIDLGWERVMLHYVKQRLAAWDRNDFDSVRFWAARMDELAERSDG